MSTAKDLEQHYRKLPPLKPPRDPRPLVTVSARVLDAWTTEDSDSDTWYHYAVELQGGQQFRLSLGWGDEYRPLFDWLTQRPEIRVRWQPGSHQGEVIWPPEAPVLQTVCPASQARILMFKRGPERLYLIHQGGLLLRLGMVLIPLVVVGMTLNTALTLLLPDAGILGLVIRGVGLVAVVVGGGLVASRFGDLPYYARLQRGGNSVVFNDRWQRFPTTSILAVTLEPTQAFPHQEPGHRVVLKLQNAESIPLSSVFWQGEGYQQHVRDTVARFLGLD